MRLSPHEIAWVAKEAGFTDLPTAVAVALAESGGDTESLGRSTSGASVGNRDHGLWQISGRWHPDLLTSGDWRDPQANARMAFAVFTNAGSVWTPWHAFTSGAHLTYMPDGQIAAAAPFPPPPYLPAEVHAIRRHWR